MEYQLSSESVPGIPRMIKNPLLENVVGMGITLFLKFHEI